MKGQKAASFFRAHDIVTSATKPSELAKKLGKFFTVLALMILLSLLTGCTPPQGFGMIKTPSAIRHFGGSVMNPDNLANYEVGYYKDNGQIFERPISDGGTMWSYPREDFSGFVPDLRGAAFSIDLNDQWAHHPVILQNDYNELLSHMAVLEFKFPEASEPGLTEINWFVTPHLVCAYEVQKSDILVSSNTAIPTDPFIWFEYIVYEDPLGLLDILAADERGLELMESGIEGEREYIFDGETSDGISGTLVASNDERSGTMDVLPGTRANLFIGISVLIGTHEKGDRAKIGGTSLPSSITDPERCVLSFGDSSYYTMRSKDQN